MVAATDFDNVLRSTISPLSKHSSGHPEGRPLDLSISERIAECHSFFRVKRCRSRRVTCFGGPTRVERYDAAAVAFLPLQIGRQARAEWLGVARCGCEGAAARVVVRSDTKIAVRMLSSGS